MKPSLVKYSMPQESSDMPTPHAEIEACEWLNLFDDTYPFVVSPSMINKIIPHLKQKYVG